MHRLTFATGALVFSAACFAQSKTGGSLVEFEMMTWPEVKQAIHEQGKTTVLVYNGGTEQRGPQNVNGGHTLMARATVKAIAQRLGNAIAAPVLPFSPNEASADLPGTIGLTPALFAAVNERVAEQLIKTGFKNVVLMGDHGGARRSWPTWRRSSMKSIYRRAFASCSAMTCTGRGRMTSTNGSQPTATRPALTPASPTRRRCFISAARVGCGRS